MKKWLVDVPVAVFLWIRPELQRKTFTCVCKARPSTLFLISDGGRNEKEWKKIRESRAIVESMIDWDCKVYKMYETVNNGTYTMERKMFREVFSKVDRVIVFEDDGMAHPSYFRFCAELLEKYKDDYRIEGIGGSQIFDVYKDTPYDYLFTDLHTPWIGGAYWKRSWTIYDTDDWLKDPYLRKSLLYTRPSWKKTFKQLDVDGYYDGHLPGAEFYGGLNKILKHQLCIIPKRNMTWQQGATDDAAHGVALHKLDKKSQQKYTRITMHPCEFPIKHPPYVMCDAIYERAFLKQDPGKIERARRRLVTICKRIYYGDGKILAQKFIDRYIKRVKTREN